MFEEHDIITCESYKGLCDYVYHPGDDPRSGLVHVNFEELIQFFDAIKEHPERNYVVVSSCSDFGLRHQVTEPVWADMPKWARMMANPDIRYMDVSLSARCDRERCREEDKYSVKCYSYTAYTFPEIPPNVKHWFMTNSRISSEREPRLTVIPFGVAPNSAKDIMELAAEKKSSKRLVMYVNWVNYTVERLDIMNYYAALNSHQVNVIREAKPYKDYLRDLSTHKFIISPEGNGVDCYRNLESIYMGSVPVLLLNTVSFELRSLPIAIVTTLFGLRTNELQEFCSSQEFLNRSLDKAKLSYWKGQFDESKNLYQ